MKLFEHINGNEFKLVTENIQDPDKEEMLNFLKTQFGNEAGFEDEAEVAMYWFANHYHGGQTSNLYSVLSTSPFSPGRISRGPESGSLEEMMYQSLESEFGTPQHDAKDNRHQAKRQSDSDMSHYMGDGDRT